MICRQFITGIMAGFLLTTNLTMAREDVDGLTVGFKGFDLMNFEYCQECNVVQSHKHADSGKECHTAHRTTKKNDKLHEEIEKHKHTEGAHTETHNDSGHGAHQPDSDESAHEFG